MRIRNLDQAERLDSGGLARNILGGPATLAQQIAGALGSRVRLGLPVHAVTVDGRHVRVAHDGGELEARFAVLATPAHVTSRIAGASLPDDSAPGAGRGRLRPLRPRRVPDRRDARDALGRRLRGRVPGTLVQHGLQHGECAAGRRARERAA